MALRFRKSISLGKGARLNFNKKSFGISLGTRGARYSINSNGRKTVSAGIPGTGLYWTKSKTNTNGSGKSNINLSTIFGYILLSPFLLIYWIFKLYYYLFKYAYIGIKKLIIYFKERKTENINQNK